MAFAFGFDNNDIEPDNEDVAMPEESRETGLEQSRLIPPRLFRFEDMLHTLPVSISYATYNISHLGGSLGLPRRALYDIRAQLMTETDPTASSNTADDAHPYHGTNAISSEDIGLSADDIKPGLYEGGFKTWECASDVAAFAPEYLSGLGISGRHLQIIELGAGTCVPSSALLAAHLSRTSNDTSRPASLQLVVADYNPPVVRLASVPNLFLAACASLDLLAPSAPSESIEAATRPEDDIEISPSLCAAVRDGLQRKNASISCVEGSWGKDFADLVSTLPPAALDGSSPTLTVILASETIYAPSSLPAFTETLLDILKRARQRGTEARGLVAAKRVYFGVGGGVAEFERELSARGGSCREVWGTKGQGVGRCILEVRAN